MKNKQSASLKQTLTLLLFLYNFVEIVFLPGIVFVGNIAVIVSSGRMVFNVVTGVPQAWFAINFFPSVPVGDAAILVGVPELATAPAAELFALGTLDVVAGTLLDHRCSTRSILTHAPYS